MKLYRASLISAVVLTASMQVQAQQPPVPQGWSVGAGAVIQQLGYAQGDTESTVFPLFSYEGEKFFWRGPQAGYRLTDDWTLTGSYRLDGYDAEDSPALVGMEDRKGTFELGFEYNIDIAGGQFGVTGTADVLGEHEGYQFGVNYSRGYRLWGGMASPFVQVSYLSDDLVDYYYGVRDTEATANRLAYEASNTINYGFGVNGMFPITDRQTIIANVSHNFFGSEIEDSPIVDDSGATSVLLIWAYSF